MSYCRAGYKESDVYAYGSGNGRYCIHVAWRRSTFGVGGTPIGGPCDGQSFYVRGLTAFMAIMLELREWKYKIPRYTFDRIADEICARKD